MNDQIIVETRVLNLDTLMHSCSSY